MSNHIDIYTEAIAKGCSHQIAMGFVESYWKVKFASSLTPNKIVSVKEQPTIVNVPNKEYKEWYCGIHKHNHKFGSKQSDKCEAKSRLTDMTVPMPKTPSKKPSVDNPIPHTHTTKRGKVIDFPTQCKSCPQMFYNIGDMIGHYAYFGKKGTRCDTEYKKLEAGQPSIYTIRE
ncbi:hypothetical protein LCGC14_1750100 [marine sediment metagenome]|uniref:Uncharacterized protein n=1 Tax=marine sediment metagenome TaxID=412755 RepID=A0A0F9H488_9ZZZZ